MTNRKGHDPRKDQPKINDNSTQIPDDTEGHSGLGYHNSGLDDDATGKSSIHPADEAKPKRRL